MKTYQVNSPAYRHNADNGTYKSLVITDDNGVPIFVHGDHESVVSSANNISDIVGMSFSDSDRFITVEEINADVEKMLRMALVYKRDRQMLDVYYHNEQKMNPYERINLEAPKDISKEEREILINKFMTQFKEWKSKNPTPETTVPYYFFKK